MSEKPPRPVVYLHVGTPKSGTTYLQGILWHNRQALRDEGLLYTGEENVAHVHASFDLQDRGYRDGWRDPRIEGSWQRTVEEAERWPHRTLISHETLALATPAQADRALADLDFAEVHLIITARDLARQIPAAWQEEVKNRGEMTYEDFLLRLRGEAEPDPQGVIRGFWRFQDLLDILQRWARNVPPERVHIVTLPPPGAPPTLVWERFAQVLGVTADRYDTSRTFGNPSLGAAEAYLLRRFNESLLATPEDERLSWPDYLRMIKDIYAQQILVRLPGKPRLTLPEQDAAWVAERAQTMIDGLRDGGYHIVGDLDDLRPAPPSGAAPEPVDDGHLLETAFRSILALIGEVETGRAELHRTRQKSEQRERLRKQVEERLRQSQEELDRTRADLERTEAELRRLREQNAEMTEILEKPAVKLFVRRLSEQYPSVMGARVVYWNAVEAGRRVWRGPSRISPEQRRQMKGPR